VIILDLEDAIARDQKDDARAKVAGDIARIDKADRVASVRVNAESGLLQKDLKAVVRTGLSALTIPKVDSAAMLEDVDSRTSQLEAECGMDVGEVKFIVQIETPRGVLNARDIAGAPRVAAMGVGMEDLAAQVGCKVDEDALYFPSMQVLYAAREAGVIPLGYLGSITVFRDMDLFGKWIQRAKSLGFEGGFCIHPNQVAVLNETLAPNDDEVSAALELMDAVEAQEGKGAFAYNGQMVDKPVIDCARRLLARHKRFSG
jgi:citrate lyase subunit beta/citryl-CoA lyase